MTTGCVDCSLFTANDKVIDVSGWESHSGNRHWFGLIVHQLHALLPKQVLVIILHYYPFVWLVFFFFFNSFLNVTQGSRRGRRNNLTQPEDFFYIGRCEKMKCHILGCTAPAIPSTVCHTFESGWKALTGLCYIILNQAEMTGENLKSNGAETKDNTLMVTLSSPRL